MSIPFISFDDGEALMDWSELTEALARGHDLPKAEIGDTFLYRDPDTLLSRAAWIDGLGMAVKTATVFPENPDQGAPMINGAVCLYSDRDGTLEGPNLELYALCAKRYPNMRFIASGGVSRAADLPALAATGAAGVVSGKALLDGRLTLEEIQQFLQDA